LGQIKFNVFRGVIAAFAVPVIRNSFLQERFGLEKTSEAMAVQ
jgi:hypothetical protein